MTAPLFKGVITALITPLRDGTVDEAAFVRLLERQIAAGVHGVVPMGTTGESATLHLDEHKRVVELAVSVAAGRIRVIAGAGSSATPNSACQARIYSSSPGNSCRETVLTRGCQGAFSCVSLRGHAQMKRLPPVATGSTRISPPICSISWRQMASPKPVPWALS